MTPILSLISNPYAVAGTPLLLTAYPLFLAARYGRYRGQVKTWVDDAGVLVVMLAMLGCVWGVLWIFGG